MTFLQQPQVQGDGRRQDPVPAADGKAGRGLGAAVPESGGTALGCVYAGDKACGFSGRPLIIFTNPKFFVNIWRNCVILIDSG